MQPRGVLLVNPTHDDRTPAMPHAIPALEPVANRPIVCHALEALRAASVTEVAVALPAAVADQIESCVAPQQPHDVRVKYVPYEGTRGASDAMRAAAEDVGDAPCIVHVAEGLLTQPLAAFAKPLDGNGRDLLLLLHQGAGPSDQLPDAARRLLRIAEFGSGKSGLGMAGVCLFGPGALRRACDGSQFTARDEIDLVAVAGGMATAGGRIEVQLVHGWRRYSGRLEDLLELNRATLDAIASQPLHRDHAKANEISGRVVINATARVSSSVIVGPAVIGPYARVVDAYVGPYTSIGPHARVEGAEIERSIVCREASIMHVSGRLADSVVGAGARVFRDFALPRAMSLRLGENAEVTLP